MKKSLGVTEITDFLKANYMIKLPEFDYSKVMISLKNGDESTDRVSIKDIQMHFKEVFGYSPSRSIISKIIQSPERMYTYNPIHDYIYSLHGRYAGVSHIDLLCSFLKCREFDEENPTEYSLQRASDIIRKWMVSSIAMWFDSIPNEVMLTFVCQDELIEIGNLCQFIIPLQLIDFSIFARKSDIRFNPEDAYTRHPFVIHDELAGINKGSIDIWSIDSWKMAMSNSELLTKRRGEEFAIKHKRIAAPIATSCGNKNGFLLRSFGFRRFGCIEIESIDNAYVTTVDVDQMWAEALMLYKSSEQTSKFNPEDFLHFEMYNAKYRIQ